MKGLSNNQLKIIAMVAMTIDHVGAYLFPHLMWMRMIGRLAFPIYAYMIAEGCHHTRSMGRYFISLAGMALVCQLAYFFAMDSLYMCIMVTFSMSVALIWLFQYAEKQQTPFRKLLPVLGMLLAFVVCEILPTELDGTDFCVDYGFIGVMIPVMIYLCKTPAARMLALALGLVLLACWSVNVQWLALLALIPLALYNGTRGKWNMKWFFYLFYPAHLLIIHGISLLT